MKEEIIFNICMVDGGWEGIALGSSRVYTILMHSESSSAATDERMEKKNIINIIMYMRCSHNINNHYQPISSIVYINTFILYTLMFSYSYSYGERGINISRCSHSFH